MMDGAWAMMFSTTLLAASPSANMTSIVSTSGLKIDGVKIMDKFRAVILFSALYVVILYKKARNRVKII